MQLVHSVLLLHTTFEDCEVHYGTAPRAKLIKPRIIALNI